MTAGQLPARPFPDPPRRILVVVTRRIGDVLLTTPLIRSLKHAWPDTRVDVLVFRGTEGVLAGNPDINEVIVVEAGGGWRDGLAQFRALWRKYDVALSTSPSDRPTFYAWAAGKWRAGLVEPDSRSRWKRWLLSATVPFENYAVHTVNLNLQLADLLGIARQYRMPLEWPDADEEALEALFPRFRQTQYAVLHPFPRFAYKMWKQEAWVALARRLDAEGVKVVLTGGPGADERRYVEAIHLALDSQPLNFAGRLSFPRLAALLSHAGCYVGPDTVTTHLAAATGIPTVALFGPSNPMKWGPWPRAFEHPVTPYKLRGSLQIAGNVALVQGETDCVPCLQEGCERHVGSSSDCLQHMPVERVWSALAGLRQQLAADRS